MDVARLEEALERNWIEFSYEGESIIDYQPFADLVNAGRWVLGLVSPCTTCNGTGDDPECWEPDNKHDCPSCGGEGWTLNPEAVERAAKAIHAHKGFPDNWSAWVDTAVAVLRSVIKGDE